MKMGYFTIEARNEHGHRVLLGPDLEFHVAGQEQVWHFTRAFDAYAELGRWLQWVSNEPNQFNPREGNTHFDAIRRSACVCWLAEKYPAPGSVNR